MKISEIKRLDHHGIVAGVIKDLEIAEFFNSEIEPGEEEVNTGNAVVAMIINGLGFSDRPLSLTPQFFEHVPVEDLICPSITADKLNRHSLGRALDRLYENGVSELFSKLGRKVALSESIDTKCKVNDTTSFSLSGSYDKESKEDVRITYGHSKDHRPDLKQIILELVASCDDGVPLHCKSFNGNASDNVVFRQRVKALKKEFSNEEDQLWIADSKLYTEKTLSELKGVRFLTRVPETNSEAKKLIAEAFECEKEWGFGGNCHFKRYEKKHYGIDQSWLVSWSEEGLKRARKTLGKRQEKEILSVKKEVFHLQAQRFNCKEDAQKEVLKLEKKWKLVKASSVKIEDINKRSKCGRPKKNEIADKIVYQVKVEIERKNLELDVKKKAAFILGTSAKDLSSEEIILSYKKQGSVERGFRFLKDPYFFVSSLYLKKPSRIEALLMVMTLSLMVYTVAQRRIRKAMEKTEATILNQAGTPSSRPTLRWVFQLFLGINIVRIKTKNKIETYIQGLKDIHRRLLKLLSGAALEIYVGFTCHQTQ